MTEFEWLAIDDPEVLLNRFQSALSEHRSRRCATVCCRLVEHLLKDDNEKIVRAALEHVSGVSEGTVAGTSILRDSDPLQLGGHPIVWADGGYQINDISKPQFKEIAVLEFAVKVVMFAYYAPMNLPFCARFAVLALAAERFNAEGSEAAARALPRNQAKFGPPEDVTQRLPFQNVYLDSAGHQHFERDVEVGLADGYAVLSHWTEAKIVVCHLLRDVLHYRLLANIDLAQQLTWRNRTIPHIAQSIYAERDWYAMPILADALEEAGCTDAAVLQHCREKREHVRGCWVLDLLLGKC